MSFLSHIAEHIESQSQKYEDITVIFPNKRAALYLRKQFKALHRGNLWMPQMLSIEEAVTHWSGIQLADNVDLLFELIAIDAELGHQGNSITTFGSMANQMANDFDEIDQYAVDAAHLFSYVYEERKIGLWNPGEQITPREQAYLDFYKQLNEYYNRLRQRLSEQGKGYYGMITRALAALSDDELHQKTKGRHLIFAGFNALTPTEQRIINTLYKNGQAEVIWDFDRYYVDDPLNEAGLFARQYIKQDLPWKPTMFADELLHASKEIHIVGATGNTLQAKALQSLLETDPDPNATLILADENLLIPVLNSIPDNGKHAHINVSMGYPLRQTALSKFVNEFFTLHRKGRKVGDQGWYLWPILRILDLEMVKVIFTKQERNEINDYLQLVRKKALFVYDETTFNSCCPSPDLQQFMHLTLGNGNLHADPAQLLQTLIQLLKFIAHKIQSDQPSQTFLLNQVSETGKAVNRLNNILNQHQQAIQGLNEVEVLYRLINNNISIKLNSSNTDGLQLMGILETRNLDFNSFYMIGVNEGILPLEKSNNSFIPYHIRKEYRLPDYQTKQAVYAYHFYRLLQQAKTMHFVFNANTSDNGGEPSRFLMQLQYELAKRNPNIKLFHESFINKTTTETTPSELYAAKQPSDLRDLSPTSLSSYISCPLKYYLKHILRIKDERLEEDAQENDIGSVIHHTLQQLYQSRLNELITPELFTQVIEPAEPILLEQAIKSYYSQGLSSVGYNYLNKLIINNILSNYLRFEKQWLCRHELYVTHVETELHTDLEVNGQSFRIKGTADRIDNSDGTIRIIDYKTGTVKDDNVKVPSEVNRLADIPEKALQLLIYKYLYLKQHPGTPPESVSAAIFGLRYEQVIFELKVENQALNEHFMETMETWLSELLPELVDEQLPYRQTEDLDNKPCRICDYKGLCVNTAKGALQADDH